MSDLPQIKIDHYPAHNFPDLFQGEITQAQPGVVIEILINGKFLNQKIILRDISDNTFKPGFIPDVIDIVAVNQDVSALRFNIPVQDVQKC